MSRRFLSSAVIAIALTGVLTTRASAQNPFNINGVVPDFGVPGAADPNDGTKELGPVNSSATKVGVINTAPVPMLNFTNPNGQVDLNAVWMQTKVGTIDKHQWLYFAWQRDASTGSGFIAFEFEQDKVSPSCVYTGGDIDQILPQSPGETTLINSCNPWKNRKTGDFMILWDQGGSALAITKRVFTLGVGFGPPVALGSAVAAISPDGFRGEAAIDLTMDVFAAVAGCQTFANIVPGTVTGNSDSADFKDTIFATFQPISNCGTVRVIKATDPAAQTGSFPFTLARTSGNIKFDGTPSASATLTFDGDSRTYSDVITADNYTLVEGAQSSPWELVSIGCVQDGNTFTLTSGGVFSVVSGDTTVCTITNHRRRGSIRVIKHVINDNGGTAIAQNFSISLGDNPPTPTTFSGNDGLGNTFTFDEGYSFNVAELGGPGGYALVSQLGDCVGAIEAGITKVCTLTNDDVPPQLTVIKHVINNDGGSATASQWTMNVAATNPSSAAFAGAEAGTTITLTAGAFSVAETGGPSGYTQVSAVGCSGTIAIGESKTCTITNDDQPATLTVIKHVNNNHGGTATANQWTMDVTANHPSSASFPGAEAPGTTISLGAGSFSVAESGGPSGYAQTSAVGCSGTIAVGESKTCTITNDDQKAAPTGATVERAVLHDTLTISGIRPGAADAADARVTFRLYSDAACSTQVGVSEQVVINAGVATTLNGVLVFASPTTVYYWRAEYTGDAFNTGFTTACGDEKTTVTFQP